MNSAYLYFVIKLFFLSLWPCFVKNRMERMEETSRKKKWKEDFNSFSVVVFFFSLNHWKNDVKVKI